MPEKIMQEATYENLSNGETRSLLELPTVKSQVWWNFLCANLEALNTIVGLDKKISF